MYYKNKQQTKIIHSNTAEEFEERLNKYLGELADAKVKYELTFNNSLGFCAYLLYTETIKVPESLAEEYEMRGEGCYCTECKYCEIPKDKRVKHYWCGLQERKVCSRSWCCDDFYENMEEFRKGAEE